MIPSTMPTPPRAMPAIAPRRPHSSDAGTEVSRAPTRPFRRRKLMNPRSSAGMPVSSFSSNRTDDSPSSTLRTAPIRARWTVLPRSGIGAGGTATESGAAVWFDRSMTTRSSPGAQARTEQGLYDRTPPPGPLPEAERGRKRGLVPLSFGGGLLLLPPLSASGRGLGGGVVLGE